MHKKIEGIRQKIMQLILLAAVVFLGFFSLMSIKNMHGTARVINFTGVVRGATQRLVKQEMYGHPNDALAAKLDGILSELMTGQGENGLKKLKDKEYMELLDQMEQSWTEIKQEIVSIRNDADGQQLFLLSEEYFDLADRAVGAAEQYSEESVSLMKDVLLGINLVFLLTAASFVWYASKQKKRQKVLNEAEAENREVSEYLSKMFEELRAPMDDISELAYIADIETYELLFVNEAGKKIFGLDKIEDLKCYKALQGLDKPCDFCNNRLLSADKNYTWEKTNLLTGSHYLLKDRLIQWNGRTARLEIAFDMTEAENEKIELKNTLDLEKTLVDCVRVLYEERDLDQAVNYVLKQLGVFLGAERSYVFIIEEGQMFDAYEWCSEHSTPQKEKLQCMPLSLMDRWVPVFEQQECMIIEDVESIRYTSPDEYKVLWEQGIKSLVAAPLESAGKLSGYIGVDNPPVEKIKNITTFLQTLRYFLMLALRRKESETKLAKLSYYDTLTNFYNRNRYIQDVEKLSNFMGTAGIVYLDVNGLKDINDSLGHASGDGVLVECANKIRAVFEDADFYRIGGDEFVIICTGIKEIPFYEKVKELRKQFQDDMMCKAAIGSLWDAQIRDIQEIIARADARMYEDKKKYYHENPNSNRYRYQSDEVLYLPDPVLLQEKLAHNHFVVYLQPKVTSSDKMLGRAEALICYQPQKKSLSLPGNFLPVLEDGHMIGQVDFSDSSLNESSFKTQLKLICGQYNIEPKYLKIEITQKIRSDNGDEIRHFIEEIYKMGFIVVIEEFGTNHIDLSLLSAVDFDVLKMDKSLVDHIAAVSNGKAVIVGIAEACKKLKIPLLAEGIETEEQLAVLRGCGFDTTQEYLISRPDSTE